MQEKKPIDHVFFYDSGDDSLTFISKKASAKHTINTGLVLVSLDDKGEIVALEFMGANKNFNIKKEVLKNLSHAEIKFNFNKENKSVIINVTIYCANKEIIISTPVVNEFILSAKANSFKATCA